VNKITEEKEFPDRLFADDLKSYYQDKEKFSGPEYEDINKWETKTRSGEPFFLKSPYSKGPKTGILLIHGFPASPAEMRPLGEFLRREGFSVYGARLKGHGTSPYDLDQTPWNKSILSVERGYKVLSHHCEKLAVIGFSIGGVIALDMASQLRKNICCAISISASMKVEGMESISSNISAQMGKVRQIIPGVKSKFIKWKTESPEINYCSAPFQKIVDVKNYIEQVKGRLKAISIPLLIIQGTRDPFVKKDSAEFIFDAVSSKNKEMVWYDSDKHKIVTKDCVEVYNIVLSFIKKIREKKGKS